eukprot:3313340-Ditylum_brightwellii.AAC.1
MSHIVLNCSHPKKQSDHGGRGCGKNRKDIQGGHGGRGQDRGQGSCHISQYPRAGICIKND